MPLYEYQCTQCGYRFEQLVGSNSKGPETCPSCSAPAPEKQFSAFAVGASSGASAPAPKNCGGCCSAGSCPYSED